MLILKRDLLILFILALFIRFLTALPQQQPNYMDAAYSYVNALNLAAGRGFVEDFVWNYLADPQSPPGPSHLYWMPLTSMVAWLGMIVAGPTYRAAQIPFVILSALLAPLTYWLAYTLSGRRRPAWLASLLMIFSGFYFPFWTAIDNFTPFALAGSLALATAGWSLPAADRRPQTADRRSISDSNANIRPKLPIPLSLLTGLFTGLAHLARADGPLLLIAVIVVYFLRSIGSPRSTRYTLRNTQYAIRNTFYLLLGYLLIITPWFIRNWQVAGTPLPTAGSQTIWLTGYDDLFSYGGDVSATIFFSQGLGPVLQGRWWALTINLQTVLAVWCMIFLFPLVLVGGWRLRRQGLIQLAGMYAFLLFTTMTLIFAFPGARGGLFHSGAALLPFIYAAAVIGLDRSVDWAAARRRRWDAALGKRVFGWGLVVLAAAMSCFIYYNRVLKNDRWNSADSLYPAIAAWVNAQDADAVVMINNPPAYRYHGGGLSVVTPNEDLETTLQAAGRYQVDYLILDRNNPTLADLYHRNVTHPDLTLVKTFAESSQNEILVYQIRRP